MKEIFKYDNITNMCKVCLAFVEGKASMKQVWHRFRGHKNFSLIQKYPDNKLGSHLFWLALDFQTWYGDRDDVVVESIQKIANYLKKEGETRLLN